MGKKPSPNSAIVIIIGEDFFGKKSSPNPSQKTLGRLWRAFFPRSKRDEVSRLFSRYILFVLRWDFSGWGIFLQVVLLLHPRSFFSDGAFFLAPFRSAFVRRSCEGCRQVTVRSIVACGGTAPTFIGEQSRTFAPTAQKRLRDLRGLCSRRASLAVGRTLRGSTSPKAAARPASRRVSEHSGSGICAAPLLHLFVRFCSPAGKAGIGRFAVPGRQGVTALTTAHFCVLH